MEVVTSADPPKIRTDHDAGPAVGDRRWLYLFVGLAATLVACSYQYGLGYLLPAFRAEGLTLPQAGLLVSAPVLGTTIGLVLAGSAADRRGERVVLGVGLGAAGAIVLAAAAVDGYAARLALLVAAGVFAASAQATSGRLVLRFPYRRRGLAMGIRQTAQPLGVVAAALVLPALTHGDGRPADPRPAFVALGLGCLGAAVLALAVLRDDPGMQAAGGARSPWPRALYTVPYLWRVHAASAMLIVPQFAVAAFSFDYLVSVRGWPGGAAGVVLGGAQLFGAAARLGAGAWSDRLGLRLRPMRILAATVAVALAGLGLSAALGAPVVVALLVLASVVSVSTNGLSNTAVTERAGAAAAGRVMGAQNSAQNLVGAATPPVLGALIAAGGAGPGGYALAFAVSAAAAALAVPSIPVSGERTRAATH
jgi:sugar phosphate permease